MDHGHPRVATSATFAAGSTLVWTAQQLYLHGPSWEVVAPILAALAALVTAYWSGRKTWAGIVQDREKHAQDLRHKEEIHRARLALIREGRA